MQKQRLLSNLITISLRQVLPGDEPVERPVRRLLLLRPGDGQRPPAGDDVGQGRHGGGGGVHTAKHSVSCIVLLQYWYFIVL